MKRSSLATVTAILLLSAVLFIGLGCSHDSSTGPADGIVTDNVTKSMLRKKIWNEPELSVTEKVARLEMLNRYGKYEGIGEAEAKAQTSDTAASQPPRSRVPGSIA